MLSRILNVSREMLLLARKRKLDGFLAHLFRRRSFEFYDYLPTRRTRRKSRTSWKSLCRFCGITCTQSIKNSGTHARLKQSCGPSGVA